MIRNVFALLAVAGLAAPASAATATVTLNNHMDGTFDLLIGTSAGDNWGIAGYAIPLGGGVTDVMHMTPGTNFGTSSNGNGAWGFSFLRSADGDLLVGAGQDTTAATPRLIRGFGQEASSFTEKGITVAGDLFGTDTWGAPLLVATGTWTGDFPTILTDEASYGVNLFSEATGIATSAADPLETVINDPIGGNPGIELSFLGSLVASGDTVDLGNAVQGSLFQHTFSIENTGDADLVLDSASLNSADFMLAGAFPTTIAASATADFVIEGDTSNLGPLSGMLSFGTNVDGLDTFEVNLSGQVVPEPSTFALAGLALVGLVGFARRRK